jgi:hypothetical protein
MTYSQSSGSKPINWIIVLGYLKTITLATYNRSEINNLKRLAGEWVTCACGNQCASLPRTETGSPKDAALRILGSFFYDHFINISNLAYNMFCSINEQDMIESGHDYQEEILAAERTLQQIEERAAFLLAEQKKSL